MNNNKYIAKKYKYVAKKTRRTIKIPHIYIFSNIIKVLITGIIIKKKKKILFFKKV